MSNPVTRKAELSQPGREVRIYYPSAAFVAAKADAEKARVAHAHRERELELLSL